MKLHIPNRTITIHSKDKPWVSKNLVKLIKKRNLMWHRYRRTNNQRHLQIYKELRNKVVHLNRLEFKDYTASMHHCITGPNQNIKKFWHYSKSIMGEKVNTSISSILDRNKIITDPLLIAELCNSYFAKQHILPSNAMDKSLPPFHYITEHRCPHLHIYPADVLMVINFLNVNKYLGPDGITKCYSLLVPIFPSLLKNYLTLLIPLLFQLRGNKPT